MEATLVLIANSYLIGYSSSSAVAVVVVNHTTLYSTFWCVKCTGVHFTELPLQTMHYYHYHYASLSLCITITHPRASIQTSKDSRNDSDGTSRQSQPVNPDKRTIHQSMVFERARMVKRISSGSRAMNCFTTSHESLSSVSGVEGPWLIAVFLRPSNSYRFPSTHVKQMKWVRTCKGWDAAVFSIVTY